MMKKIKQLFQAEDAVESMVPLYVAPAVMGVLPYRVVLDKYGNRKLTFSVILLAISMSFVAYTAYCYITYFPNLHRKQHINGIISACDYFLFWPLGMAYYLANIIPIKTSFSILHQISRIDSIFKSVQVTFVHEEKRRSLILHIISAVLVIPIYDLSRSPIRSIFHMNYSAGVDLRDSLMEIAKVMLFLKSHHLISAVQIRFEEINRQLLHHISKRRDSSAITLDVKLRTLRMLHEELCETCEIINSTEASPIFFVLSLAFVMITVNIFYLYNTWCQGVGYFPPALILTIMVCCQYGVGGVCLIPVLSRTSKEVKNIFIHLKLKRKSLK